MKKRTKLIYALLAGCILIGTGGCEKENVRQYDLLPEQEEPEMDITSSGTISVNFDNASGAGGNEGSLKLVDNDYNSKFLINPYRENLYMQLAFPGGIAVSAYVLASANDAQDRDPKNWQLVGSNDMENWTVLDSKTDYMFTSRLQKVRFDIENATKYRYYRLNVTAIRGGTGLFQMAEWRLIYDPNRQAN
ncbi:discoidin domain-containing protein [Sphingobacterium paludis]|uniref:F5/8 type C domain-containing protein n=1 Tax=Sphingobacterium paludis TaxID=1476465 RepID=A0A4R7D4V0_9SPHI|nr:discoidin domain-containing protein [Sphingobacterium paludis]TDS13896.1 F5/8 type C domain-containing protein [Sphingobacterium paludis]